jgi:hypothetical protein
MNCTKYVNAEAKKYGLELEYVDWGIANRVGKKLLLNKNLLLYEDYCKEVMAHEVQHSGKLTKSDFMLDLLDGDFIKNLKFAIKHPKAFLQFIPISVYKGQILVDINQILIYLIMWLLIGVYLWLL